MLWLKPMPGNWWRDNERVEEVDKVTDLIHEQQTFVLKDLLYIIFFLRSLLQSTRSYHKSSGRKKKRKRKQKNSNNSYPCHSLHSNQWNKKKRNSQVGIFWQLHCSLMKHIHSINKRQTKHTTWMKLKWQSSYYLWFLWYAPYILVKTCIE